MIEPTYQSNGRRRLLRRDVRSALGTGNDSPPGPLDALRAAQSLAGLVDLSTGGRFGLSVHDFRTGESLPIGDAISVVVESRETERRLREMRA